MKKNKEHRHEHNYEYNHEHNHEHNHNHEHAKEEIKKEQQVEVKTEVKEEVNSNNILEDKVKKLEEALLRNQAELMNYKRRKDEEVSRMLKYSEEDIIREFLPILDNFERAIKMDDDNLDDEVSKFLEGFKMVYTQIKNMLDKFEVKEIEAFGKEFDPTYHQAVMKESNPDKQSGIVLEVFQKGYMYKDRVIRPSMVKVNE